MMLLAMKCMKEVLTWREKKILTSFFDLWVKPSGAQVYCLCAQGPLQSVHLGGHMGCQGQTQAECAQGKSLSHCTITLALKRKISK